MMSSESSSSQGLHVSRIGTELLEPTLSSVKNENSKENGSTGGGDCLETEAPPLPVITLSAPDEEDSAIHGPDVRPICAQKSNHVALELSGLQSGRDSDHDQPPSIQPTIVINEHSTSESKNERLPENSEATKTTSSSKVLKSSVSSLSKLSSVRQRTITHSGWTDKGRRATLELPLLARPSQESDNDLVRSDSKMKKFEHTAHLARIWKRKGSTLGETITDEDKRESETESSRSLVEVPRAVRLEMLEDAYLIIQKTSKMYKAHLGPKHPLSVFAEQRLEKLKTQLGQ